MPTFGEVEIHVITEGAFWLDGGAMFGVVPRSLWSRALPPDEKNRIKLGLHSLLVVAEGRRILIDAGVGDKFGPKESAIYRIERREGGLAAALRESGFEPEDVTDVVFTHLHFDHAGGATRRLPDGALALTFANAVHHVQRRHWEWGQSPTERDQASFLPENMAPLRADGRLDLWEGATELGGIRFEPGDTHTVGMQTALLTSGGRTLLHCADLIPTSHHVRLPYIMGYDLFPLGTLGRKRELLPRAADEGWCLFFQHDPVWPLGTVARDGRDFSAAPAPADLAYRAARSTP